MRHTRIDCTRWAVACAALLTLTAWSCDDPKLELMVRWWSFHQFRNGAAGEEPVGAERGQVGGSVDETQDFGPMVLFPQLAGPNAKADVFSSKTGSTYWVSAQAPSAVLGPSAIIGNSAELTQYQYFRKTVANASLQVVVTKAFMESIDENGGLPTQLECPWHRPGGNYFDCRRVMQSWVDFDVSAFSFADQTEFLKTGGFAELKGFQNDWVADAYTHHDAMRAFWSPSSFGFEQDVEGDGGGHAVHYLASPITIDVPLASVPVGELFYLLVVAKADTLNHRQRESYLSAYFRDPQQTEGLAFSYSGLEPVETPTEKPPKRAVTAAPACATAPDPQAGTLEFDADAYEAPELPGDGAIIVVTRSGGSRGAVSVLFTTSDDTAIAGADYQSVATPVLFADGEEGARAVRIPILLDDVAEPDKTVKLTLSQPMGCASLGTRTAAVLTIMDDDRPIVLETFSIGGVVTGLAGTGLLLREVIHGLDLSPGNGSFAFPSKQPSGANYDVRVISQPTNPIQICTVTGGTGTVSAADITGIAVDCTTPPPDGTADPGFGSAGKVTSNLLGGATAMALQADGKILVVQGLVLARFTTAGALDSTFGTSGVVHVVFNGGLTDEADSLVVQPDGRIVVGGFTRATSNNIDFAVARYESNGAVDTSFGTGGRTNVDFDGTNDQPWSTLLQSDGAILVAGHAGISSPVGQQNDFAVVRLSSAGALDTGFGPGGKPHVDIAGATDLAHRAVLQSDGKIVLAGRVARDGGSNPDIGLVRFNPDGSVDSTFGTNGIVRLDVSNGDWDEATDLVITADGKFVVAIEVVVGTSFQFGLVRLRADGTLDTTFGTSGLVTTAFGTANDYAHALALQADGKIVLVGQSSNLTLPDFGIIRYDADGALDTDFGNGGKLTVDFFGSSDGATCVAIQPDGKIVVAGFARSGSTTGLGLVRLLP